jgi:hypothetical protein
MSFSRSLRKGMVVMKINPLQMISGWTQNALRSRFAPISLEGVFVA